MTDKLKPCPFCKKDAELFHEKPSMGSQGWIVRCASRSWCGARQYILGDTGAASSAWNRRTPDARLEAERAVIEAAKKHRTQVEESRIIAKRGLSVDEMIRSQKVHDELLAAVDALADLARTEKKP